MSQQNKKRDRTAHVETLRTRQDLESTEEEVSEIVEDACDDDANVSDGRHTKQSCRDFSNGQASKKKRNKAKTRSRVIT